MGSCVSLSKGQESSMKLDLSVPSPVKQDHVPVNRSGDDVAVKPRWSTDFSGSKDEAFFDSQPWLDSDCEDDFISVNGDFTPSRGSTPVHHSFQPGNLRVDKAPVVEGIVGSPTEVETTPDKKKRLSELFKDSLRVDNEENTEDGQSEAPAKKEAEATNLVPPKPTNGTTPYLSGADSGANGEITTPNGLSRSESKSFKSTQCCLPVLSSRSYREKKKRVMSPAHSVG